MIASDQYESVYLCCVVVLTLITGSKVSNKSYFEIKTEKLDFAPAFIISVIFALWIGFRPVSYIFGDTVNYAHVFSTMKNSTNMTFKIGETEYLWNILTYYCAKHFNVNTYFAIVAIGYFGFALWACKRLTPNHVMISLLFVFAGFSFFSYGTNGIRNGLACSIVLVVLSYMTGDHKNYLVAVILGLVAINIHKSTALPLLMMIVSLKFIKTFHWAYGFWLTSIVLSVVAGGFFMNLFGSLGFDDRVSYITGPTEVNKFSQTGFRWDFILYSMMPIVLGYYIVVKRKLADKTYLLLLNTYTLANAFWVLVIRANYSNRFAYLSWFMYGIVLAYPLLKLNVWNDKQGAMLYKIMLAQVGFTLFMLVLH